MESKGSLDYLNDKEKLRKILFFKNISTERFFVEAEIFLKSNFQIRITANQSAKERMTSEDLKCNAWVLMYL